MLTRDTTARGRRAQSGRTAGAGAVLVALMGLTACITPPPSSPGAVPVTDVQHVERVEEHWEAIDPALEEAGQSIMMTFTGWPAETDDPVWHDMFALELEAGEALLDAGVGYLDGNGSDGEIYQVFFGGNDHAAMWSIIEPIYADAPLAWSEVQGWSSLDAEEPALELYR
ncbi:hypothetical protein ABIB37_002705 [Agrococcus sp. UYP10]